MPYLLQIGDPDALLYVNAFSLLFFSIQMLIMCEGYFFPQELKSQKDKELKRPRHFSTFLTYLPAVVVLVPLFLQAVGLVDMPQGWRYWMVGAVSLIFAAYFLHSVRMALRIRDAVRRADEERYADSDDFPVRFANIIRWVPTLTLILLAINFYADNVWVKFGRDILFIVANVWFCLLTLNPWRKMAPEAPVGEMKSGKVEEVKSGKDYTDLVMRLEKLLSEEHIFTEPHITSDLLISRLGTNSKYLAGVIRRSGYQSFYDMISQHRVRHAISLIHLHPDSRLADIAEQCGFSSQASMAKAFKAQGKETPSSYRER